MILIFGQFSGSRTLILLLAAWGALCFGATANAATATFKTTDEFTETEMADLGAAGDNSGALLGLGETLTLLFDTPFATERGETVTIATVPPVGPGQARFTVRFGFYNDGDPIIVVTRTNVGAGNTLTLDNLFQRGCSAFGGCDYIEIITTRADGVQTGVEIDYVDINGETVAVTAATPEPGAWALMIASFILVAWRARAVRRRGAHWRDQRAFSGSSRYGSEAICSR